MKTNGNRKWFKKAIDTSGEESLGGWNKTLDSAQRRVYALVSRSEHLSKHEKYISAGRALQALANVTTDKVTKTLATQDAEWFFDEAKKFGEGGSIYNCGGEAGFGEGDILLKHEGDFYYIYGQTEKGKKWMLENDYLSEEFISAPEAENIINDQTHGLKVEEFKKGGIPREGAEIGEYYDLRIGLGGDISRKEKINRAIRDLFLRKDGVLDKKIMDDTIKAVGKRNPDYIKVWKEFKKTFSIEDKDGKYINPYLFKKGGNIGSGIIEFMKRKVTFSDFNF